VLEVIALLFGLLIGTAHADFCFPQTCTFTPTGSPTATFTVSGTSTPTPTPSGSRTATPTANPTKFSVAGQVTAYAGVAAAAHGLPVLLAAGYEVASSGAGAQSTNIVSFTVATTGLYRVFVQGSTTTVDTITAVVIWTDSVNVTTQTKTVIAAVPLTNGAADGFAYVNAVTLDPIIARITISSQATSKFSATIERLR
jgi:hypothetical protein